jgi:hypothetical protein
LYPRMFCIYGRFVERTFCREGRYVEGRFVDGRFVEGRFVVVPGNRPRWYSCFLLAGHTLGNAPSGSPLLFGHFPKFICYLVKVAEKVSNTLWAFPKMQ